MTISPGGALYAKLNPLTLVMNNLTNNGRVVNAQGGIFTVLGNMSTDVTGGGMDTGSGNSSVTDTRTISNAMTISGSGPLTNYTSETAGTPQYWQTARGTVIYTGNNSALTGPQVIMKNTAVVVSSQANLGGDPGTFNPAQLLFNNGVLRPAASFSLNNPNSGITLSSGGGSFDIASGLFLTNANALAGPGTLTLTNTGTLVHRGSATDFTGTLAVNGGTLILGTGGSLAGANTISVGSAGTLDVSAAGITLASGQTLGGVGSVLGNVTAGTGSTISPAGTGGAGTLGLANLTLTGGATMFVDFASTNDVVAASGTVNASGVTTIQLGSIPPVGSYTLLMAGTLSGTTASFHVNALVTRNRIYALSKVGQTLVLTVTSGGTAASLVWQGDAITNPWDINTSSTWLNGAVSDVYFDGDTVNFTDAGVLNQPILDVTVNPGPVNITNSFGNNYNLTGMGGIAGPTSVNKSGTGTATLSTTNSYTGGTFITDGVLQLGASTAPLGSPSGATLASVSGTGTLDLNGAAADATAFTGYTKAVQINGHGFSATQGAIDSSTGFMNPGTGDVGINNLVLAGDSTVSANASSWQIGATGLGITGNGRTLTKIGNNYLYLRAAAVNPLANFIVAQGGVTFWNRANALGTTAAITLTNGSFIDVWDQSWVGLTFYNPIVVSDAVNGGALVNTRVPYYNHAYYNTYNGSVTLNGPLFITNTAFYNGAPNNVDTFSTVTINGPISGPGGVTIIGDMTHFLPSGVQGGNLVTFNGNNSYSGPTLVSNLVQLLTTTANQSGGAYEVVDYGTLDVTRASGKPTLPMSSLNVQPVVMGSGNLSFSRLSFLSAQPVIYATNFAVGYGTTIFPPVAGYAAGQFPLIKYSGTIGGGGFAGLMLAPLPTGVAAGLVDNAANHSIDLAVTNTGMLWKGNLSSTWDVGGTANWFNPVTSAAETYADGETVVFDNTASSFNVNIPAPVAPMGITVNASSDYTFSGVGAIGSAAALIKTGTSTLTMAMSNNTFTGGTYINGGTVKLADANYVFPYGGGALNNNLGKVTVADGATLDINGVQVPNFQSFGPEGYDVYLSGAGVGGNGALVNSVTNNPDLADPGYLTLVGDATVGGIGNINIRHGVSPQLTSQSSAYTLTKVGAGTFRVAYVATVSANFGAVNILQGNVSYESSSPLGFGDPTKAITVASGAGFTWGTASTACQRPLVCSNGATLYGINTTNNVFNGPVSLVGGNVTLNANNFNGMIFNNVLSGAGGVTLLYNSYATFAAANTYTGDTIVSRCNATNLNSILRLVGNGSLSSSPNIILQGITTGQVSAGALDVSGRSDGTLTLVNGQTLRGDNGSYVRGNVVAGPGTTLTPGGAANIQYMTVSNSLTLQAGSTVAMDVSMDAGTTNDTITVTGTATYGGTLQLANLGATALAAGNTFKLFKAGTGTGSFAAITGSPGPGLNWSFNPATGIATVLRNPYPPYILSAASGNQLTLAWPTNLGWILQVQTNSLSVGLAANWVDVPGSATVTQAVMTVNPANSAVFYRMR